MTAIKQCSCKHQAQDELYGKGNRVMNVGGTTAQPTYKCTVCSNKIK